MKIHFKGKYDLNPDSLPHDEHLPGAVMFKEAKTSKEMSRIVTVISIVLLVVFAIPAIIVGIEEYSSLQFMVGAVLTLLLLYPHEILHGLCFKKDVYIYTNISQGMFFIVGTETMSKGRFIFMSLLPNILFGFIPYIVGLIFPQYTVFLALGVIGISIGAGDYYNVYNAMTQMPKGSRTYLHKFNSYWYMPK